ncbi:hypothetical protein [Cohnella sp. JJ-181]|uniref:hypothetical protein n=1 Tax=Cohnella rhizoplanae TaxID=2974897 RepID=UPI0022FFB637|nr:hypothetical protein [Cohnella sp. JJ-181]CAI6067994.1 hypothetical protein COHCIP112018_02162 [Cohnella sp. JJ-181]
MTGWRATKALAAFEFKRDWLGLLFTAAFALYVGAIISTLIDESFEAGGSTRYLGFMKDWLYTFTIPVFGCAMNRTVFAYWRGDIFTKRLAHWRTMPIPVERMASARMLLAMAAMAASGATFFVSQYLMAPTLRDRIAPGEWAATAIAWLCYGLIVNAVYLYLETGFNGKIYVKAYTAVCILLGLIAVAAAWSGANIFDEVLRAAAANPVLVPAGAAVLAAAAIYGMRRAIVRRMRSRSYTF